MIHRAWHIRGWVFLRAGIRHPYKVADVFQGRELCVSRLLVRGQAVGVCRGQRVLCTWLGHGRGRPGLKR